MERLTQRVKDGILVKESHGENAMKTLYQCFGDKPNENYSNCEEGYCAMEKLAEYEDAEEKGLLFRFPCKVGDIVWNNDFGKPCAYTITAFSFGECGDYISNPVTNRDIVFYCSNSNGSINESFAKSEIGKTVFFTEKEAEAKLAEMRGEQHE